MTKQEAIAALGKIATPNVCDAVEKWGIGERTDGLMDPSMRSLMPGLGPMIGYAVTGKVVGEYPITENERCIDWTEIWTYVQNTPGPTVMVVQDLDQPPGKCCPWGDVSASIFLRLGAVGTITNAGVRDLPDVEAVGFHLFAPNPVVGHAHTRWVEMDTPVKVGSLVVTPGDLLHGDEHGVMVIPREIDLPELVTAISDLLGSEKSIVDYCENSPEFEVATLDRLLQEHFERTERK